MQHIDIKKVRRHLSDVIKQTSNGEHVIITENGEPVAKLIAIPASERKKERQFGSCKGFIKIADDFDEPLEDFREYM